MHHNAGEYGTWSLIFFICSIKELGVVLRSLGGNQSTEDEQLQLVHHMMEQVKKDMQYLVGGLEGTEFSSRGEHRIMQ